MKFPEAGTQWWDSQEMIKNSPVFYHYQHLVRHIFFNWSFLQCYNKFCTHHIIPPHDHSPTQNLTRANQSPQTKLYKLTEMLLK